MRWLKVGLWLLLLTSFVFGQSNPCQAPNCAMGILEGGGTLESIDTIIIDASRSDLSKPLEITLERLDESQIPLPLSPRVQAQTAFYKISSTTAFSTHPDRAFDIYVPLPQGALTENLVSYFWMRPGDATEDPNTAGWDTDPIKYIPERNAVRVRISRLDSTGDIFVIASGAYTPK